MAITYGYFNSVDGDRKYNADQMSEYFDGLVSNGVYESVGGALQVIAGTDMSVNVQTGRGIINCKWINNNAVLPLTITQAHAMLDRYTAVVMKLDITNRLMTITTKDGTAASTPVKPTLQNDATGVELCLAWIYVNAGATTITQDKIEDARPSSDCGWVTGLIEQVDTSTLFLQYRTAYENYYAEMTEEFDEWFSTLTDELNVNTYIKCYKKEFTFSTTGSQAIPLDMTGYNYAFSDIINVYINGLLAKAGTDYVFDSVNLTITPTATASGTEVIIEVLKSKIGFAILAGNGQAVTDQNNNNMII